MSGKELWQPKAESNETRYLIQWAAAAPGAAFPGSRRFSKVITHEPFFAKGVA